MKKLFTIAFLIIMCMAVQAQDCPLQWKCYTTEGYFHDVESGKNNEKINNAKFKSDLLDQARTNLSKQIQVKVEEVNQINKNVVNGKTNIEYASVRQSSTDVDMQLAESKSYLDPSTGEQYVIVYINKEDACKFYENEIKMFVSRTNKTITIADNYIKKGFKTKAKNELTGILPSFEEVGQNFFWLNVFGMDDNKIQEYLEQVNQLEQTVKMDISDLENSITYCVVCKADNFGKNYPKLANEIKGELSTSGCNFVDKPNSADYVVSITAKAREYNTISNAGGTLYVAFVDATVAVDKVATKQRIFEDEVSEKGIYTMSFSEAGRDGYKKISKSICNLLKENIKP